MRRSTMGFLRIILTTFFLLQICAGDDAVNQLNEMLNALDEDIKAAQEVADTLLTEVVEFKQDYDQEAGERKTHKDEFINALKTKSKEITEMSKTYQQVISAPQIAEDVGGYVEERVKISFVRTETTFDKFKVDFQKKQNKLIKKHDEMVEKGEALSDIEEWIVETAEALSSTQMGSQDVENLYRELQTITRQVQLQQFNEEEKVRSDGNSGIKQIRSRNAGEKNYYSNTHSGSSFASMHNHDNNERTIGMGEFIAVLNGIEFRTRHNDYSLRRPSNESNDYERTEMIEFPDVPPAVLEKETVDEEIEEMQHWFKAFHDQDYSVRDYRKYFKPVLCYLEGAWTVKNAQGDDIDEPFDSDRHHIDAKTWFDLQEKVHFSSYSGTKSRLENLAHLPTTIMDFDDDGKPIFAQWNYRILCHPLSRDLPTRHLKLIEDITVQKMKRWDVETYKNSRAARFDLQGIRYQGDQRSDSPQFYTLLDKLMEEIPGKNNYNGEAIFKGGFDASIMKPVGMGSLNTAYYHRPYRLSSKDAMGTDQAVRGYSDVFWLAMTTQDKVAGPSYTEKDRNGNVIKKVTTKASYAIPLEVIYMTPLANWNPHNIEHEYSGDITGRGTPEDPYIGTTRRTYFRTPSKFFTGVDENADAADTTKGAVHVQPKEGVQPVPCFASGVRITFPSIAGIDGLIRQRYPIMPVYGEGSSVWKKLNAMEDSIEKAKVGISDQVYFSTSKSHSLSVDTHSHVVTLDKEDVDKLKKGDIEQLEVTTGRGNSHTHAITIVWDEVNEKMNIIECPGTDGESGYVCWDHHEISLTTSDGN